MTDSWLEQFEVRLDLLEQLACNKQASFGSVLELAQSTFATLTTEPIVRTFLVRPDGIQQLKPDGRTSTPELPEVEIRKSIQSSRAADEAENVFVGLHPLADDIDIVCHFETAKTIAPLVSCREGAQAITTVTATFVSRHLLSQYESRLSGQSILTHMVSQLSQSRDLAEAAAIIVNDGASVLGDCRLTLLANQPDSLQVIAVTGVSEHKQTSATLAGIQRFVQTEVAENRNTEWLRVSDLQQTDQSTAELFEQSNVRQVQILPLPPPSDDANNLGCYLLIECFSEQAASDSGLLQQLVNGCVPYIQRHLSAQQPLLSRFVRSRTARRLLLASAILALLAIWPVDFEIEVRGQIQATNWQRLYAPDNGTVETVYFHNESQVSDGEKLLTMSNPDIELQLQRITGEILTTTAKLTSARTNRLTGNDPQASINEQILQTQLSNLEVDRTLIQKQADELIVKAPFDGTVFLRDPQNELAVRPVQRGQLLLQIVANNTDWQLELDIPDQLRQYVVDYQRESTNAVRVRYVIKAASNHDWTTNLTSVDNAVQVSGTELVCKATATIAELPAIHQRPGTSVTARIYCGRRSVGFVWFREVIEFWHQFRFAWL